MNVWIKSSTGLRSIHTEQKKTKGAYDILRPTLLKLSDNPKNLIVIISISIKVLFQNLLGSIQTLYKLICPDTSLGNPDKIHCSAIY